MYKKNIKRVLGSIFVAMAMIFNVVPVQIVNATEAIIDSAGSGAG